MNDLKGSKILVLGGAGFIGSHVVSELLKEDVGEVVIYDNFVRGNPINIKESLKKDGIPTAVYYPRPLHLQTAFEGLGYKENDFPISEDSSNRIFSLPMHPYLKAKDVERICAVIIASLHL